MKSLIGQQQSVAYVLTASKYDFYRVQNSFVFKVGPDSIEVVTSIEDDKYVIEIQKYIRDVFTSDKADDSLKIVHHKNIGPDKFGFILNKFLKEEEL